MFFPLSNSFCLTGVFYSKSRNRDYSSESVLFSQSRLVVFRTAHFVVLADCQQLKSRSDVNIKFIVLV